MNAERSDFDRALVAWFEDGPTMMSDRVIDGIADRIARQPQRRAWRLRRRPFMNGYLKLAAGIAAVLVIAVAGYALLREQPSVGGATSAPSPTATPSPTPTDPAAACLIDSVGCAGDLDEGAHMSSIFDPRFTFTVFDGDWVNDIDLPMAYQLNSTRGYILVWGDPGIVDRTAACETTPTEGLGNTPADWVAFVAAHPGLIATNVRAVNIHGYAGQSVDLSTTETWAPPCEDDYFFRNLVQFIGSNSPSALGVYGVTWQVPIRLVVLDLSGRTVVITYYASSGPFDDNVDRAQKVIDTMNFCSTEISRSCPPA